jgi:hypothetical protein
LNKQLAGDRQSATTFLQDQAVKIGLGNTCIEIRCQEARFIEKAHIDYRSFLVSRHPDFWIRFNLRDKLTASEVKQVLANSRSYLDGERFFTVPELLECRTNWSEATLWLDTEREIFAPSTEYKLINSLLRGIYSGIYKKLRNTPPDAYLVHGCGVVDGGKCYLFTGPSGSGKTTIAKLAGGRKVLNDEAVLIGREREGFHISATPFDGGVSNRCNTAGYLSGIFFLRHDTEVSLRQLSRAETYRRFLTQVFDTSPLFDLPSLESLSERADLAAEVATDVPSYELGFRPDPSFWDVVGHI